MNIKNQPRMHNIRRLSRIIITVCRFLQASLAIAILFVIMVLFDDTQTKTEGGFTFSFWGRQVHETEVTEWDRWIVLGGLTVLSLIVFMGISVIIRLFSQYQNGALFNDVTATCFRHVGCLVLAYWLSGIAMNLVLPLFVSKDSIFFHPYIDISVEHVSVFVLSLSLIAISVVMSEAHKLKQHDDLVI